MERGTAIPTHTDRQIQILKEMKGGTDMCVQLLPIDHLSTDDQ